MDVVEILAHCKSVLYCSVFCRAENFYPFIFVIFWASFLCATAFWWIERKAHSFFDGLRERHPTTNWWKPSAPQNTKQYRTGWPFAKILLANHDSNEIINSTKAKYISLMIKIKIENCRVLFDEGKFMHGLSPKSTIQGGIHMIKNLIASGGVHPWRSLAQASAGQTQSHCCHQCCPSHKQGCHPLGPWACTRGMSRWAMGATSMTCSTCPTMIKGRWGPCMPRGPSSLGNKFPWQQFDQKKRCTDVKGDDNPEKGCLDDESKVLQWHKNWLRKILHHFCAMVFL